MSGRADLRAEESLIRAHALHSMILERCRRPLGHEMKNAVQSLYSGIEILARSTAVGPAARISPAECVSLLRQQLDGLQRALDRVLDEVAAEPAEAAAFDLGALLTELVRFLGTDAAVAGVKLRLQVPEQVPAFARPTVVRRVLLAFVLNAIDDLRGGGTLAISATAQGDRACVELLLNRQVPAGQPQDAAVAKHASLEPHYVREVARDLLATERGECSFDDARAEGSLVRVLLPGV